MDYYKGSIPILDDGVAAHRDILFPQDVGFGMTGRDFNEYPLEMFGDPTALQLIPSSEDDARYDEQEAQQSSLEHIYLRGGKPAFVNLDQNVDGDCWAYSGGHAVMLSRLRDNLDGDGPVKRLNPHYIAAYLRRYNGGWCGASAKVLREVGCCEEGTGPDQWPLWSHGTNTHTPDRLAGAAKHKTQEDWYDLTRPVHGQVLTARQLATCSHLNVPVQVDFTWWRHSVCQVRVVRIEAGSWGRLILNSWKNWGRFGLAVLRGSQAVADGAVAIRNAA